MKVLFTLGIITLVGWTLGQGDITERHNRTTANFYNWDKSPLTLQNYEMASSFLNKLEVCPQEVPRCPSKAEPRCVQSPESLRNGSPPQGSNTEWKCILCEETTEGTACFGLTPIETYAFKRPEENAKINSRVSWAGNGNREPLVKYPINRQYGFQPEAPLEPLPNAQVGQSTWQYQQRQPEANGQQNPFYNRLFSPPNYGYQLPYDGRSALNPYNSYGPPASPSPYAPPKYINAPQSIFPYL